jgi:hypothetical protein
MHRKVLENQVPDHPEKTTKGNIRSKNFSVRSDHEKSRTGQPGCHSEVQDNNKRRRFLGADRNPILDLYLWTSTVLLGRFRTKKL